jgi:hypothetical protein
MSAAPSTPEAAYREGRHAGFAISAFAVSVLAYLNLLSAEKSIFAIVLAIIALQGAGRNARRWSWLAIAIGAAHMAIVAIVLVLFHDKLIQLIQLLHKLG